jgi:thiamine biosynthesis lipoprotein
MKMNRRNFLKLIAALGLGSSFTSFYSYPHETRETRVMMGTYVTISVLSQDTEKAGRVITRAYREMNRLVRLLSRYDASSQVSRLNSAGVLVAPAPEFREVLGKALYYSRASKGAFDVTVAPLLDLYRESFSRDRVPTPEEIKERLRLVDYRRVSMEQGLVYFDREGMQITLDGVAKGYIVDKAVEVLEREGIAHALVDAGGDIRAVGGKYRGKSWRIGVRHPVKKNKPLAYYSLNNEAIATSGGYEVYFDDEKLFTHIIDPKTGYSPSYALSVTVAAKECADADAVSTACFVMDRREGPALMRGLGTKGLIVTKDGEVVSHGFEEVKI